MLLSPLLPVVAFGNSRVGFKYPAPESPLMNQSLLDFVEYRYLYMTGKRNDNSPSIAHPVPKQQKMPQEEQEEQEEQQEEEEEEQQPKHQLPSVRHATPPTPPNTSSNTPPYLSARCHVLDRPSSVSIGCTTRPRRRNPPRKTWRRHL